MIQQRVYKRLEAQNFLNHFIFSQVMSLLNCSLCERDLNPFDYAFHLRGDEHQRRLANLSIPVVDFDLNPFLTPPPSPFSSIDFSPFSLPGSPIEFFPVMSAPSTPFLSREFVNSTPIISTPVKKPTAVKSPKLNDSLELGDPAYAPMRYFRKRLLSDDGDENPMAKSSRV